MLRAQGLGKEGRRAAGRPSRGRWGLKGMTSSSSANAFPPSSTSSLRWMNICQWDPMGDESSEHGTTEATISIWIKRGQSCLASFIFAASYIIGKGDPLTKYWDVAGTSRRLDEHQKTSTVYLKEGHSGLFHHLPTFLSTPSPASFHKSG